MSVRLFVTACVILIITFCFGCTPDQSKEQPKKKPAASVQLVPVDTIGIQETESRFVGDYFSVTVEQQPFRMYIPDMKMHRVAVLDSTGQILRYVGSFGSGPGELERPRSVAVIRDQLYVEESNRYSVFDTSGAFLRTHQLPEGLYGAGRWSLNVHDGQLLLPIIDRTVSTETNPSVTDPSLALLDDSLRLVDSFGRWPSAYAEIEGRLSTWMDLYPSPAGMVAQVFTVRPDVYLYDMRGGAPRFVARLDGSSAVYNPTREGLSIRPTRTERVESALAYSTTLTVAIAADTLALMHFANRHEGFFEDGMSEETVDNYVTAIGFSGKQHGTWSIPGEVLAQDAKGRLYISHSKMPDEREIGVYRVALP